jgi:hypothetical protein
VGHCLPNRDFTSTVLLFVFSDAFQKSNKVHHIRNKPDSSMASVILVHPEEKHEIELEHNLIIELELRGNSNDIKFGSSDQTILAVRVFNRNTIEGSDQTNGHKKQTDRPTLLSQTLSGTW